MRWLLLAAGALGLGLSSFLMVKAYWGGDSSCVLGPLPGVEVTASSLSAAIDRTWEATAAARRGAVDDAELAFSGYCTVCTQAGVRRQLREEPMFGKVHDLAHNVDQMVRPLAPDLAKAMCLDLLALEEEFWGERRPSEVARLLEALAAKLEAARRILQEEGVLP